MDSEKTINKSTSAFFLGTFFSKISGMFRDITMAFFWGSGLAIANFMVAYRFAGLFRRLLGEVAFQSGFAPNFEFYRKNDKRKGALFYRDFFFSLLLLVSAIVLILEMVFYWLFKPSQVLMMIMIMAPSLIFISLYALNGALLQCEQKYFLPSVAPIFLNLAWIFFCIFSKNNPFLLALGVMIGFALQCFITMRPSFKFFKSLCHYKEFFRPVLFSPELRKTIKLFFFAILGIGATQLNTALDPIFARIADLSGPAYLWYSARLYQLPLSLFGVAIAGAILPPLSRSFERGEINKFKSFIKLGTNQIVIFMIIAMAGIFLLGGPSINLIYTRGEFNEISVINSLKALWGYAAGLLPATLVMIFSSAFYAQKNYKIPIIATVSSVLLNIFLNSFFIFFCNLSFVSIALSTSISSFLNLFILAYFLHKKFAKVFDLEILMCFLKTMGCVSAAFLGTFLIGLYLEEPFCKMLISLKMSYAFEKSFFSNFKNFSILSLNYFMILTLIAFLTKFKEFFQILRLLFPKKYVLKTHKPEEH